MCSRLLGRDLAVATNTEAISDGRFFESGPLGSGTLRCDGLGKLPEIIQVATADLIDNIPIDGLRGRRRLAGNPIDTASTRFQFSRYEVPIHACLRVAKIRR